MNSTTGPAVDPITASDAEIAAALEHASVPCLLMSMIHMSGDTGLLDGANRPQFCFLNDVQCAMPPEQQAAVRAQALEVIRAYRDRGCTPAPAPAADTLQRMMSFLVAGEVPAAYVPMMLEEMELDGRDARDVSLEHIPAARRAEFPVLVIGAGMSGLLAGIRLEEHGIPYVIVEKNAGCGGTWYENTYPGCRVDVGNHFYCYSFAPNLEWSEYFARQPELRRYFESCADRFGVRPNIRFNTEVKQARYDEVSGAWDVTVQDAEGRTETLRARAVISGVGQLNRPKLPDVKGIDSFVGPWFHSAQWDHSVSLAGKRVAVIGTGASAFQLVPEVAKQAASVTVFQRSPQWMFPNPAYHEAVTPGAAWCFRYLPGYARWFRFLQFWPATDGTWEGTFVDPEWPDKEHTANAFNEIARQMFAGWIQQQVGDDPELLAKVMPSYPPMGKRTLQDNGSWLQALKRPNVELVDAAVREVRPQGVVTGDGRAVDVDVIVYATGFHANRYLWPMEIVGRDGVVLGEQWGDDPAAYLGMTMPNFPNLFVMYGPATNLAASGSLIFHGECQMRYILGCIRLMLETDARSMEVRAEVHDEYNERLQETLARTIWSHPAVKNSWYRNSKGRVTVLSPWKLLDYWSWTRVPDPQEFDIR